jgi:hypothetical protein
MLIKPTKKLEYIKEKKNQKRKKKFRQVSQQKE